MRVAEVRRSATTYGAGGCCASASRPADATLVVQDAIVGASLQEAGREIPGRMPMALTPKDSDHPSHATLLFATVVSALLTQVRARYGCSCTPADIQLDGHAGQVTAVQINPWARLESVGR